MSALLLVSFGKGKVLVSDSVFAMVLVMVVLKVHLKGLVAVPKMVLAMVPMMEKETVRL